ncbi:FIST signal transduction protein [Roseivirga sp.]|uniref:FIST signal transduction protein n=1 Tax=Roseivirga sp. TaxID=1964215 RepID=UPI003B8B10F0
MNIDQFLIEENEISYSQQNITTEHEVSFVLIFASRNKLESATWLESVQKQYPETDIISCSTSGEIYLSELKEETVTGIAISFSKTATEVHAKSLTRKDQSKALGRELASAFSKPNLKHILVFGDGWLVNGSDLVRGMYEVLDTGVSISGGLAGDGANFSKTLVGLNEQIDQRMAVAIGLYGDHINIGFGSHGGWSEFGESFTVSESSGREILKLEDKRPFDLYEQFLGDDADGLPGTALLYPVAVWLPNAEDYVVRTVFNIDEVKGSITLGEAVSVGTKLQFMRARFDDLLLGVKTAAEEANRNLIKPPELALMVSCIGRKLLFNQRIEEEIKATHDILGEKTCISGFYSYGEICPVKKDLAALHHQMLTLTVFAEY